MELTDKPTPVVASIRLGAGLRDQHDYEVEMDLLPAARLSIRYQSVDEEGRDGEQLDNEGGAVSSLVKFAVKECLQHGASELADLLHDLRVRTRKVLSAWASVGTNVAFVDVRMVWHEYIYDVEDMDLELRLQTLDDRLRPVVDAIDLAHPYDIEQALASRRQSHDELFALKTMLSSEGADGLVDETVLRALAPWGDVREALRKIMAHGGDHLSGELSIFRDRGHVRCHGYDTARPKFGWNRDTFSVVGEAPPESVLVALRGQPATALVRHPMLSDEMVIIDAVSGLPSGEPGVRIHFSQPVWRLCSASGRHWRVDTQ